MVGHPHVFRRVFRGSKNSGVLAMAIWAQTYLGGFSPLSPQTLWVVSTNSSVELGSAIPYPKELV